MVKITVQYTGFFIDRPKEKVYTFKDDQLVVDKIKDKKYIRDMDVEETQLWFEENYLSGTSMGDRIISLHVKKTAE